MKVPTQAFDFREICELLVAQNKHMKQLSLRSEHTKILPTTMLYFGIHLTPLFTFLKLNIDTVGMTADTSASHLTLISLS